ncbi:MAG: molecular chaperone HtpG [Parachlamydiaceae bacterium]|nr:molecular chaperone HtpG [Parachlamydiaceae bacterium]
MEKGTLEIHSENILPIIKKWLYSDKDIFVRELVSNACDAIQKVKVLRDRGELQAKDEDFRIDIESNKESRTLKFTDNGIGMTADEVKKYIAQIAFSGAEEFLSKYKSNDEKDQIIGHFGLGFYSAYMVADKVEINTLSYHKDAEPVLWICDGTSEYELDRGTRQTRGTEITLFINKENDECLDKTHLKKIVSHYCTFLPYAIYLDGERINEKQPLWIKSPSECTKKDYIDFYHYLYPMEEDPLFWVHLNVDYPFHLKGILYFPRMHRDFEMNKISVQLYCNRVFVADNCKDLIPDYLTVLRGVIDSPDIPLNVSRSYLQMDKTVRLLASHISKKVSDSIATLYHTDKESFIKSWPDISPIIKLGILEDEKFYERVKDIIIWQNTSKEWTTIQEYLERNNDKTNNKVLYTSDEKHAASILEVYRKQGIEVLCANNPIDPYLIHYIEGKISPVSFQRIDAEVHENILDKTREKTVLDAEGKTEAAKLAEFVRSKLSEDHIEVEAKSLADDHLPGFITIDEKQRRMRDHMMRINPQESGMMGIFGKKTFIINTNNSLFSSIQQIDRKNPELAKDLTQEVYELALLSQREMGPDALHQFISRSNRILEALTKEALR